MPPGMHGDRRLANVEFSINDMQKCIRDLINVNNQDHKTLQDAMQEAMNHMGDWRGRLSQEMATLKTNYATLLDEHRALQKQMKQLRSWQASASPEVARLQVAQREAEACHRGLCDCLLSASSKLEVPQLRVSSRARAGLTCLDAALSDRQVLCTVAHFSGSSGAAVARLASASRGLGGAHASLASARAQGSLAPPLPSVGQKASGSGAAGPMLHDLDTSSWQAFADFEPSREVLGEWARNEMVQHAFGSFGVQGIMGAPEVVNFSDVYSLFGQIELSIEQFVNKFTYLPKFSSNPKESELKAKANAILRHAALEKVEGEERISSSDVYRLLELVGYPLERFRSIYKSDEDGEGKPETQLRIGSYRIRRQIGQGFHGVCCYLGEKATDSSDRAAIKWPASKEEIAALEDIHNKAGKDVLGVPRLIDHGFYEGQPYLVTDLLGSTLASVFELLTHQPPACRWPALRLVGRLVVRRLQSLHASGYVHCDMSPDNVLVGPAPRGRPGEKGSPRLTLYLIDYELAQKYPGGAKLTPDQGSAEWSSIRSADGGERLPEDDLEAVGWVLLNGLAGALPWFEWLQAAYKDWDSKWVRQQATKQVQRAKTLILEEGWGALPSKKTIAIPEELGRFLYACRQPGPEGSRGKPDYECLLAILGGRRDLDPQEADRQDLLEFEALVAQVNRPQQEAAERRRLAQASQQLKEALASKDRGQLRAALLHAEEVGLPANGPVELARTRLQDEEARDLARHALEEAVASAEHRRICSALREAELAGLSKEEMADARRVLDDTDDFG